MDGTGRPFDESEPLRPAWRAGLAGWLAQTTLAWVFMTVAIELDNRVLDEGHMFEGDGKEFFPRPPAMLTSDWFRDSLLLYGKIALLAATSAILLTLIMAFAERRGEQPGAAWLLAGAAAALPIALYAVIGAGSPSPPPFAYLIIALVPCAFGLFGGWVAWRLQSARRSG